MVLKSEMIDHHKDLLRAIMISRILNDLIEQEYMQASLPVRDSRLGSLLCPGHLLVILRDNHLLQQDLRHGLHHRLQSHPRSEPLFLVILSNLW